MELWIEERFDGLGQTPRRRVGYVYEGCLDAISCFVVIILGRLFVQSPQPNNCKQRTTRNRIDTRNRQENRTSNTCGMQDGIVLANLEAVSRQVSTIGGQIESIGLSCQTEKQVLQERIVVRNMMIVCLLLIGVGLFFLLIRRR